MQRSFRLPLLISSLFGSLALTLGCYYLLKRKIRNMKYKLRHQYVENQSVDAFFGDSSLELDLTDDTNKIKATLQSIITNIISSYPPDGKWKHHSLYYGSLGLSFLFWRFYKAKETPTEHRMKYLTHAIEYANAGAKHFEKIETNQHDPTSFSCGFLFGQSGFYTMQSFLHHLTRQDERSEEFLQKLISESYKATEANGSNFDMMYGSSGYLSCCLFLRENIPSFPVDTKIIPTVFSYLLVHGEANWRKMQSYEKFIDKEVHKRLGYIYPSSPYAFGLIQWMNQKRLNRHNEVYGMLHGTIGILYQLLLCPELVHSSMEATVLIRNSLHHLMSLKLVHGNYPSGLHPSGSVFDSEYVQWCQGATSFGMVFIRAFEVFQDKRYIQEAQQISDIIWEKGIQKELGICRGVAGNGYFFLSLYRVTSNPEYLMRARCFAVYICDQMSAETVAYKTTKDNGPSLFTGQGGIALFLSDVLHPESSSFPILEDCS